MCHPTFLSRAPSRLDACGPSRRPHSCDEIEEGALTRRRRSCAYAQCADPTRRRARPARLQGSTVSAEELRETAHHNGGVGKTLNDIDDRLAAWLVEQPVFFVATAPLAVDGLLNCSPKGNRREFAVVGPRTVAYLDQTGSGVETIAHVKENGRVVVMFCAFTGPPRIVRLHGVGRHVERDTPAFERLSGHFDGAEGVGVRAIILVEVTRISDSCGYGVPLMTFDDHRPTMDQWASRKGSAGIRDYWAEKNCRSIDDLEGLDL